MKNPNWLSSYAPSEIAVINNDPTAVQITTISEHQRIEEQVSIILVLKIPQKLNKDPLCLAIIAYCKSEEFINLAPSTRKNKHRIFSELFSFLDNQYGDKGECDVTAIHPDWINNLNSRITSVHSEVAAVNSALKWYVKNGKSNNNHITRINAIQKRIPRISRDPGTPRLSLSNISELEYDDSTLIKSLRMFCVVMLKKFREQRAYLLSVPQVQDVQSKLYKLSIEERKLINSGKFANLDNNKVETYIRPLWEAIKSSNDPILIERMLVNCAHSRAYIQNSETTVNLDEQKKLLADQITKTGTLRRVKGKKATITSAAKLNQLSYDALLKPTKVEEVLISMLLASERIQSSGQLKLEIEDYYITGDNSSWDFSKNRSSVVEHTTPMYGKKSAIHETYKEFIKLASSNSSTHFTVGISLQSTQTRMTFRNSSDYDPYLSVALNGSYLRSWLISRYPVTKPFIDLLTTICKHNDSLYNSYGNNQKGMVSIALSYVAQSVAIISNKRGVREKQNAYEKYGQTYVEAALNAHTPEIRQNIYINRSETITRINERKWFSEVVSEEMVKDAINIRQSLSNSKTKVLSLAETRKILGLKGIKPDSDDIALLGDFLDECAENNAKTGCFGDIKLDNQTIVVELPITAALMLSYQSEIEKKFQKNQISSNRRKAYLLSRYLFVDETLNKFETSTIESGKKLLEKYDIPAPPIYVDKL
ncbi:hypothetical protein K6U20_03505 [Vibrio fluvialis]|uniref:hypothetical protein n=2 Tax=Vibrio fluvialis TaxID=676 RepID=UPI001EEBFD05|nr:hypothetical protein [Vibrio fluvialis]MCG6403698.1 hypothetical protein [Vibrio fluvialis]